MLTNLLKSHWTFDGMGMNWMSLLSDHKAARVRQFNAHLTNQRHERSPLLTPQCSCHLGRTDAFFRASLLELLQNATLNGLGIDVLSDSLRRLQRGRIVHWLKPEQVSGVTAVNSPESKS